jgi:hypothetical protein
MNADYSSTDFFSDNPPIDNYDPFPDTSLGAEAYGPAAPSQEQLGQQIITDTQRGIAQEQLGRDIVEGSVIDQMLANPDNTLPWYKGISGDLAGTAKLIGAVAGLSNTGKTPTQGGVPVQLGSTPYFGTRKSDSGVYSIYPSNTTRDGRTGTLQGGSAKQTALATLDVGGLDFLYIGLGLVGAFFAYKAVRALT